MNGKPAMFRFSLLAGAAAAALLPQTAFAQPAEPSGQPADASAQPADSSAAAAQQPPPPATYHTQESQEIVITGFRRNRSDVLSGTSVLSGEELTRDVRPTIGDTLTRQPGVSATSYGPNASRPIL